jgi:ribulose-5-phosphate 4-epimerase/fuculose-1-phosphate aldolase
MGLIHGTSGNIAMRDPDEDVVAITPSGIPYKGMTADQIAIVDLNGKWLDGPFKPSSEVPMHTAVMRARKDVNATVHTHSMYATICAMGENPQLVPITPPQCEFTPVGIVSFTMPGSNDVADKVRDTLGENGRVCLIKNHGMFSCGKNMKAAMHATVYTEEMAQTTVIAKTLGTYEPMPEEAVKAMQALIAADQAV